MVQGYGIDAFLDYTTKTSGRGNGRLKNWKKSIDEKHGQITFWLHTMVMPIPVWTHQQVFNVVEVEDDSGEKKLKVFPRRFNCHEGPVMVKIGKDTVPLASLQKWRNDDGTAEHQPTVCPNCILPGVVAQMVNKGQIGYTDVVFEWRGSDEDSLVQLRAGGIYGDFRKKEHSRERQVAMRKALLRKDEAFKHDMRTNLKYLLLIVDDGNVEQGLVTTFESEALAKKIRSAIVAEGDRVQKSTKIDMRDDRVRGRWDPAISPYPFSVEYDDTQEFEHKYKVTSLVGADVPDAIRELIVNTPIPKLEEAELGNCYELRAELEAHCKVKLPWDEIFGPAKDAGLMVPPQESKEEVHDEDQGRTPEISSQSKDEPIKIGPEHVAWKNKAFKPGPEFKGRDVFVLPPEGLPNAEIDRVIALFKTVALAVGEIVACNHCAGEMTTFDPSCPTCRAQVDDDGKLVTRPCVNPICQVQVHLVEQLDKESGLYICPSCATTQKLDENGQWVEVKREEPAKAASPQRRRRGAA